MWAHQNRGASYLLRRLGHPQRTALLAGPTGCGKTRILKVAATVALDRALIKGAIIITPQEQGEEAFCASVTAAFTEGGSSIPVSVQSCFSVRGSGNALGFLDYMANPGGRVLVTTQAQFRLWVDLFPSRLDGFLVIVDEGHHKGKDFTELFRACQTWLDRGAYVWSATGTPYRADERQTFRDWPSEVFSIPYSELVSTLDFPKIRVQSMVLQRTRSAGHFHPKDGPDLAQRILDEDILVGGVVQHRPTVIHVAKGNSKQGSERIATQLQQDLVAAGFSPDRILNGVGVGVAIKDGFKERVLAEREILYGQGFKARTLDVIISCKRMMESGDWPAASMAITVGLSSSAVDEMQKLGRILRTKHKIADYPSVWKDDALYVAVLPHHPQDPKQARLEDTQRLLEIALHVEISDSILDYARHWEGLTRGFRVPPIVLHPPTPLSPFHQQVKLQTFQRLARIQQASGTVPSLKDLLEDLNQAPPNPATSLGILHQALLLNSTPALRKSLHRAHRSWLVKTTKCKELKSDALVDQALQDLVAIAQQYQHVLLTHYSNQVSHGFVGLLDAPTLKAIVVDLESKRNGAFQLDDLAIVQTIIDPYIRDHGRPPGAQAPVEMLDKYVNGKRLTNLDLDRMLRRSGIELDTLVACRHLVVRPHSFFQAAKSHLKKVRIPTVMPSHWASASQLRLARHDRNLALVGRVLGNNDSWADWALALNRGWWGHTPGTDLKTALQ